MLRVMARGVLEQDVPCSQGCGEAVGAGGADAEPDGGGRRAQERRGLWVEGAGDVWGCRGADAVWFLRIVVGNCDVVHYERAVLLVGVG